jgi:N-acetylmuramic acid 6-phosphate etherase
MAAPQTELRHARAERFDLLEPEEALAVLAQAQAEAALAVQPAIPQIAAGAALMSDTIRNGGQLVYAAAGSSGLMALADALELPGTYGLARDRVKVLFAGGMQALSHLEGGPEDDADAARAAIGDSRVGEKDCVIALTASGYTPYPMAAVEAARQAGARTIGLANNAGAPLFDRVDVAICLETPPEVVAGSTRMGAGTAQKIALNMLSTMMAVHLGHVHDGYMVNVVADNIKLRGRAKGIISQITQADEQAAAEAIEASGGNVKLAILLAAGARTLNEARDRLAQGDGKLRPALAALKG